MAEQQHTEQNTEPHRLSLLSYPLDPLELEVAAQQILAWAQQPAATGTATGTVTGKTVVTINPEIVVQAEGAPDLAATLRRADLVVADGIGITWAAKRLLRASVPRVPGVDLALRVMQLGGPALRVYFLGGKPGVAEAAAAAAQARFGIVVAGSRDGYFGPTEAEAVAERIRASGAQLLLTALGGAKQEQFNDQHRPAAVAIGVGGTLDVLAGVVERAPAWTGRVGLEWLWRIVALRRWERAGRLGQFVLRVLRG
jgi:N-acetylglucosaminyldiphosphoundecaprenol N-acetyl-beta-D-mannosaminyltransferase